MRLINSSRKTPGIRGGWEPPTVTVLAIGTETKSVFEKRRSPRSENSESVHQRLAHPKPPAMPATKLGFAFEWSFPLSIRTE